MPKAVPKHAGPLDDPCYPVTTLGRLVPAEQVATTLLQAVQQNGPFRQSALRPGLLPGAENDYAARMACNRLLQRWRNLGLISRVVTTPNCWSMTPQQKQSAMHAIQRACQDA